MTKEDRVFHRIAEALLVDYTSVYYVNARTNEYRWYSVDPKYHSLQLEQGGKDFFKDLKREVERVIYEEDRHIFMEGVSKEKLLEELKEGVFHSIVYRLLIDGKPLWHTLRLLRGAIGEEEYFILGVLNVDQQVRRRQEAEKAESEREIFNQLAGSLAEQYDTLYYVNIENNQYYRFSTGEIHKKLQVPAKGEDFFVDFRENLHKYVVMEDQERALAVYRRENLLKEMQNRNSFSMIFRIEVEEDTVYCSLSNIWTSDRKHIIVSIENINEQMTEKKARRESERKSRIYGQIAESLAANYDVIYYVDSVTCAYIEYMTKNIYGSFEMQEGGKDFFSECARNIKLIVYPEDQERMLQAMARDQLFRILEERRVFGMDYRLVLDGRLQYTRLNVSWAGDRIHLIIGVQNVDEEMNKEKARQIALNSANEIARRDGLTGVKNKYAYHELEENIQENLDHGLGYLPFALAVCDINGLKQVNDTKGHAAGDAFIQEACKMICDVFLHSPVYRIGGDEFVVFLTGNDHLYRYELCDKFKAEVLKNEKKEGTPIVAIGMAEYDDAVDRTVLDVFKRADERMYRNKKDLKKLVRKEVN